MSDLPSNAKYIGDGVYIYSDGYHIWFVTYDGYRILNCIAFPPDVLVTLYRKLKDMYEGGSDA